MQVYEMNIQEAQDIVNQMSAERGVRGHVIIAEYLKYRDNKTLACSHMWPNQNSACYTIHTALEKLN